MNKAINFFLCILVAFPVFASKLDINIIYEASRMKIKETVCGWQPDFDLGYVESENDCYQTIYEIDVPMYGFIVEPKSTPLPQAAKVAYYLSFFDSAVPKDGHVKTVVLKDGKPVRTVTGIRHDRTFEGLVIMDKGESLQFSSKTEPSYTYIYIIAVIFVIIGSYFILRKRK
ncbi:hypothetical protein ACMC5R_02010 [Deferribacteres bacterium DY0037]|uniref:hypothetical protein n=1 Tax=Denitrovibrio acetiphilus TaxID=118000 RepID=UPI00019B3FEF|nr:hypothetical protein [Denitrovibrio acetiphilus]